jgi:Sel1 repeat
MLGRAALICIVPLILGSTAALSKESHPPDVGGGTPDQTVLIRTTEDGFAAYERGDFATALRLWGLLAGKGDVTAQNNLGVMYYNGNGVSQDFKEAVNWYRSAAVQGFAAAQYNLGMAYERGQGVPQRFDEAVKWYRFAACHVRKRTRSCSGYYRGGEKPKLGVCAALRYG